MVILISLIALVAYAVLLGIFGRPSRFTLLDHQRGILYRRGLPVKEVGSGRYWVWTKREKFFWADTRPIQVGFENQAVILRDGTTAGFGILASTRITDVRKAIYSAQNYNQIPAFILLCCTRAVLNGVAPNQLGDSKGRLAEQIMSQARPKLSASGFELLSFSLTQLYVASPQPRAAE